MTADPSTAASGSYEPAGLRPQLRASDADRERTVHQLRQHLADGRLTIEEFTERIDAAYAARTLEELARTRRELPYLRSTDPVEPVTALHVRSRTDPDRAVLGRSLLVSVLCCAALVVLWLLDGLLHGELGGFWPIWPILGWACHLLILARAVAARTARRGQPPLPTLRSRRANQE